MLPKPSIERNDRKAYTLIGIFSVVVFGVVAALGKIHIDVQTEFDVHIFAGMNAAINSLVAVLLIAALIAVKKRKYLMHRKLMSRALVLSVVFLVFYITHHLLSGDTLYGDSDHNGVLSQTERSAVSDSRGFYLIILITHIFLASVILPFILLTAYRGLTAEYPRHRKLAKVTWPIWLYVSITGPVLFAMIRPYYE